MDIENMSLEELKNHNLVISSLISKKEFEQFGYPEKLKKMGKEFVIKYKQRPTLNYDTFGIDLQEYLFLKLKDILVIFATPNPEELPRLTFYVLDPKDEKSSFNGDDQSGFRYFNRTSLPTIHDYLFYSENKESYNQ